MDADIARVVVLAVCMSECVSADGFDDRVLMIVLFVAKCVLRIASAI